MRLRGVYCWIGFTTAIAPITIRRWVSNDSQLLDRYQGAVLLFMHTL